MHQTLFTRIETTARFCLLVAALFSIPSAEAQQTFTVDRLTDTGEGEGLMGDLRYCITNAADDDTITFMVAGAIYLNSALPDLSRSINIEGPGANLLTVGGRQTDFRVFTVTATVSISGLTITNGAAVQGGGIFNSGTLTVSDSRIWRNSGSGVVIAYGGGVYNSGVLIVSNSTISENEARNHFSTLVDTGLGGGIYNSGTLIVSDSTISGNVAGSNLIGGGDIGYGGGICNLGTLTVNNSTISGNTALADSDFISGDAEGGGIWTDGTPIVINSTISGNQAAGAVARGGGIVGFGLYMRNTILAGNRGDPGAVDFYGRLTSSGYNLIGDARGGDGFDKTDLLNVNPLLGPLRNNGGSTFTHALLAGSPAIDAGDPDFIGPPNFDQRGEGFPRIVNDIIDIGAFEVQADTGKRR